jgi:hypothetical protein
MTAHSRQLAKLLVEARPQETVNMLGKAAIALQALLAFSFEHLFDVAFRNSRTP